ncbi:glycoside hydrolase family 9 protein [Actinoplanes sp. NPDC051494]|uniref:glycoside hydrolase family 9 protein n=1 Tax=Actinoplanes sp. NPDC051494 TaxID=3363907 RepID=UPI0037B62C52
MIRAGRPTMTVLLLATLSALAALSGCTAETPEIDARVRVDQVGYATGESKIAMLLAPRDAGSAEATVVDEDGDDVFTARIDASRGTWNAAFPMIHPVDLSGLDTPGTYRIRVRGAVTAESPPFRIAAGSELFAPLAANAVRYFQAHRDGADQVAGPWDRQPAHLDDRAAAVHDNPGYDDDGTMTDPMTPTGDTVDVEGGWYDAGDYLKFTHTTAYALVLLQMVQRDGPATEGLAAETRHGVDWLDKMWDEDAGVLYTQVGVGSGAGFAGDHDKWRLPQSDDALDVGPGDDHYYLRYRPVFRANDPGQPLSPNLAGRVGAAFALAAQVEADTDPARARAHLDSAARIFELAATDDVGELVTAEPRRFYPENSWTDDMATGAAELALAAVKLGDDRAGQWAQRAAGWAEANADSDSRPALSLYNLSVIADAELGRIPGADRTVPSADLRARLDAGIQAAAGDPMGAAAGLGGSDYTSRQLGYTATALLYRRMTGDDTYARFATAQRSVVLGANGWGTSLIVGAGTTYPRCPHDQISSLTGDGEVPMTGAAVNGPQPAARFTDDPDRCADFAEYDRPDVRYTDAVRSSASSEPAIDFTATSLLAFALTAQER